MREQSTLEAVSDDELLRSLSEILRQSRRAEADLVAHVAEVDARKLYLREAAPSMYAYCTERLHLSEAEAWVRIRVARASRKHPMILPMLREGRLHLSGIVVLAPHLTQENQRSVLKRAVHKTKRQIEELVAEIAPREDVPARIRKLPARRGQAESVRASGLSSEALGGAEPRLSPDAVEKLAFQPRSGAAGRSDPQLSPDTGGPAGFPDAVTGQAHEARLDEETVATPQLTPETVGSPGRPPSPGRVAPSSARTTKVEPLAPARFKVQFTASAELLGKLERLQALMRSSVLDGDLATIIDVAVTRELECVEGRRFGKTRTPRKQPAKAKTPRKKSAETHAPREQPAKTPRNPLAHARVTVKSRHIPAAERRVVHQRDGSRCTYRDKQERRCTKRHDLEFHHREPFGYGGDHRPENLALMCRAHNAMLAEQDYGNKRMARFKRSESGPSVAMTNHRAGGAPTTQTRPPG